jgi:hypothetical protein
LDKKAFQISSYVIGIVIFVMVIIVGMGFIYKFAAVDSSFVTEFLINMIV